MNKPVIISKRVRVADIIVPMDREISAKHVEALKKSIQATGQTNPITVTAKHVLVDGYHRLEALRQLNRTTALAQVVPNHRLEARAIDIDLKLSRQEIPADEMVRAYEFRRKLWEALNCDVPRRRNGLRKTAKAPKSEPLRFADFVAQTNGVSPEDLVRELTSAKLPSISEIKHPMRMLRVGTGFEPDDLVIDKEYQRKLNQSRVERIAAEFDVNLMDPPLISRRDGVNLVVDGQHRIAAIRKLGLFDMYVECRYHDDWTQEIEARVFIKQQGKSQGIGCYDAFRAEKVAKDEASAEVRRIIKDAGLSVDRGNAKNKIGAIDAVKKAHAAGNLERTLRTLVDWSERSSNRYYHGTIIRGVSRFLDQNPKAKDDRLLKVLRTYSPDRLMAVGRSEVGGRSVGIAKTLLTDYNKGLGPKARL